MGLFNKIKNSRIAAFFRMLRGQKALPSDDEILREEKDIVEKTPHEKFSEELKKEANDISKMTRTDAILKILKEAGLRDDILKNQDAVEKILEIAEDEINDILYINGENEEEVRTNLSKIVKNGIIEKVEEKTIDDCTDSKITTIDVDDKGRLVIGEKTDHTQNLEEFIRLLNNSEKSESEALQESGYESKIVYEQTIIECGVEMEKTCETIENVASKSTHKDSLVKIIRNPNLVTASVEVKDLLTNETRSTKDRWANITDTGRKATLTGLINEDGKKTMATDIEQIDRLGNGAWCLGTIPSYTSQEDKERWIKNAQEEIKKYKSFKRLLEKANVEKQVTEKDFE